MSVHVHCMPPVDVDYLPTVNLNPVDVDSLPTVNVNPVDVDVQSLADLKITEVGKVGPVTLAGIPDTYSVAISSLPDLNLRIKEIPSIRAHVPADFRLGLSLLGVELAALHLCGEAQIITEPYVPNLCELCGPTVTRFDPREGVSAVLHVRDG